MWVVALSRCTARVMTDGWIGGGGKGGAEDPGLLASPPSFFF